MKKLKRKKLERKHRHFWWDCVIEIEASRSRYGDLRDCGKVRIRQGNKIEIVDLKELLSTILPGMRITFLPVGAEKLASMLKY